jgi:hypothetical protein
MGDTMVTPCPEGGGGQMAMETLQQNISAMVKTWIMICKKHD